jgi:hypothetical protein
MVDQATGHVYDGMNNAGTINTVSFTYNEGLFIGAIVELARVTGDTSQLALAHKVAGYMMRKETKASPLGTVLNDSLCGGDFDMFKGIGARYLGELYEADPTHVEYRDFLHRSADAAWTLARDPATGEMSCDWTGPFDAAGASAGTLGAAALGLAAAARALGPGTQRPPLTYEAEEGDLHGIGLEARYGAFSGWAYVTGWSGDGQSIDLLIDAPAAGDYAVDLRYAAASSASRAVSVNGAVLTADLAFPSTGGYANYDSVPLTASLRSGRNRLSIAYTSASGSGGPLNLDRASLTRK